jgi:predicted transcriptional regulator
MATSLKIDEELKGRIQHLADLRHRSAHWIMCEAIKQYVVREEACESFKQEAIRAWESYKANGLHVTQDEADAWLAQLEAGKDAELPECHE